MGVLKQPWLGRATWPEWCYGLAFRGVQCLITTVPAGRYATAYPNIRTFARKYMTVRPFAIDSNMTSRCHH